MRTVLLAVLWLTPLCLSAQDALAPGNPPLTESLVREYAQAMGKLLGFASTQADVDFFRAALRTDWAAKQQIRMALLNGSRQVESRPAAEQEAGYAALRPRVVALLEKSGDREAQYLLSRVAREPDLDALLRPRREDDARLDTEGILPNQTQSTYPPRGPRSRDALENVMAELQTERSYLEEADLRKMVRYFEWSLEVQLVNSERNELRRRLIALHAKNGGTDPAYQFLQQGVGAKVGSIDLSMLDDPFADHKRREVQRERVPQLQREAGVSDLARWLLARYQAAHPPLTPGPHSLTPAVARVYAEHVVFALNEVVGKEVFQPNLELTKALLKRLLADWPRLSESQREEICALPFDWAAAKKGWPTRPEYQKTEMRLGWGKEFSPVFPEIKPFHEARATEVAKAKAKVEAEQRKRAAAESARVAAMTPQQRAQETLNNQMLASQMAMMAMQNNMQMQQQMIQSMQRMQLQSHVTNMNIASNIGGGHTTWRIVYR